MMFLLRWGHHKTQNEDDAATKNTLSRLPGSWLEAGVNSWFCGWRFSATAQYSCNFISCLSELLFPLFAYTMGKWTWRNPSPTPPISKTIKDIVTDPVLQLDFSHVLGFSPTPTRKQNQTFCHTPVAKKSVDGKYARHTNSTGDWTGWQWGRTIMNLKIKYVLRVFFFFLLKPRVGNGYNYVLGWMKPHPLHVGL